MNIMRLRNKLASFKRLSGPDKGLLLCAIGWLAVARIRLAFTPFGRLSEDLAAKDPVRQKEADPQLFERIGFAVRAAANNVPWRSDCFPQAIAAREMLRRYGHASTIYLGVDKVDEGKIAGHAWLTCGDTVVTGGETMDRYSEVHRL